jgi:hypothetical protein
VSKRVPFAVLSRILIVEVAHPYVVAVVLNGKRVGLGSRALSRE